MRRLQFPSAFCTLLPCTCARAPVFAEASWLMKSLRNLASADSVSSEAISPLRLADAAGPQRMETFALSDPFARGGKPAGGKRGFRPAGRKTAGEGRKAVLNP